MREVTSDLERNEPMFSVDKRHPRQPCTHGGHECSLIVCHICPGTSPSALIDSIDYSAPWSSTSALK